MSEAAKAAKFPTSAPPRQVLQKRPGPICCKYMGLGRMCRILMLWRCMRWQSWHRNVGRCGGQTGILADQDREAINAQQNQQVMHPDESAKVKASVDRWRSARCRWSTSARWTSECDVRKLTTGASAWQLFDNLCSAPYVTIAHQQAPGAEWPCYGQVPFHRESDWFGK